MRTTWIAFGVLFTLALSASSARAQFYPNYGCGPYVPTAPDACGPGFYATNCYGQVFGPNYNLYPPFAPWNGALFPPAQAGGQGGGIGGVGFPTHPFARSPRDFYMYYEREQDWSPYNRGAR
jgi:hypothetical protein